MDENSYRYFFTFFARRAIVDVEFFQRTPKIDPILRDRDAVGRDLRGHYTPSRASSTALIDTRDHAAVRARNAA